MKKSKKRLWVGLSVLFGVILVGVILVPVFIDVDKFRPEITRLANEQLNGKLELGKLKLKLWGKIAVGVENAKLTDLNQKVLLSVGEFELALPFAKLITARPEVQIRLQKPTINLERNTKGDWDVSHILRKDRESREENPEVESEGKQEETKPATMPGWIKKAGVSLSISEANLAVVDQKSQSRFELKSVSLKTGLLSLETLPTFSLRAQLKTALDKEGQSVSGPFEIDGKAQGKRLKIDGNFDSLDLALGDKLKKKEGIPLRVQSTFSQEGQFIRFHEGELTWDTARARFEGSLKKPEGDEPLEGNLSLAISGVPVRGPFFKQSLALSGEADLTLNDLKKAHFKLKGTGFDLGLKAEVSSFVEPKIKVRIESEMMDLDQLLDWKEMKAAEKLKANTAQENQENPNTGNSKTESLTPAKKAEGDMVVKIRTLKAYNVVIEPITGRFAVKNLKLSGGFEQANVLGGQLQLTAQVDASQPEIQYSFQSQVKNLSLEKAVSSQMDWLKNTLTGSLTGEISGSGAGMNATKAKKALKASGRILVKPAKFSSIDINQMVIQGLKGPLSKLGEKIPGLRGREVKMDSVGSEFQQVTSSFSISEGKFVAPDFYAQAVPGKGVELRGNTQVGMLDYGLLADWEISDPYNVLKIKDLSVEEKGFKVEAILVEKGKAFRVPVKVRGSLFKPDYDYGAVSEALAGVALKNISLAAQDRVKAEVKKQAEEKIKQLTDKAPAPVQQILKGIFK